MSGFFSIGETKERPGIYKRIENIGARDPAGARDGIGAAVVSGNWGPLNVAQLVEASEDYSKYVGYGSGYDTVRALFAGGVKTAIIVRVGGTDGTNASVDLDDTSDEAKKNLTVTAKYPGTFPLSVSVKKSLTEDNAKVITISSGLTLLESRTIPESEDEVSAAIEAFKDSAYVKLTKKETPEATKKIKEVTQADLAGGKDPKVETGSYSKGFDAASTELFDSICVDSNDTHVHLLLAEFINRIYEAGSHYPLATVSEPKSIGLDVRMQHAAAFNDEKMHYVLNGWVDSAGETHEGYLAAAYLAGMIGGTPASESITHKVITGAVSLLEPMTNSQIISALKSGCIVISKSKSDQIMVEKGINTLVTPGQDKDKGWKKIRRTKTRFEMMDRVERTLEPFVGIVNNDNNGRAAIIAAGQSVLEAMIGEGKVLAGATFALDESNPPAGDSAWFIIQADDIDSFEIGYLTFQFRFSPES